MLKQASNSAQFIDHHYINSRNNGATSKNFAPHVLCDRQTSNLSVKSYTSIVIAGQSDGTTALKFCILRFLHLLPFCL